MFFGLDLAWADHHPSGACAVDRSGAVVDERLLSHDDEIVSWVEQLLNGPAVVAADIPLRVPNEYGRRGCESEVSAIYGGRHAGPHSSNRSLFLRRYGRVRGEDLSTRLAGLGFGDPWSTRQRTLLEVYPHPGLIEVFGLQERLSYKKGRLAVRAHGLRRLAALIASLGHADPPVRGPDVVVPAGASGRELKAIEDLLDARFCAWIAGAWGTHGTGAVELYGDSAGGHIAVPRRP